MPVLLYCGVDLRRVCREHGRLDLYESMATRTAFLSDLAGGLARSWTAKIDEYFKEFIPELEFGTTYDILLQVYTDPHTVKTPVFVPVRGNAWVVPDMATEDLFTRHHFDRATISSRVLSSMKRKMDAGHPYLIAKYDKHGPSNDIVLQLIHNQGFDLSEMYT